MRPGRRYWNTRQNHPFSFSSIFWSTHVHTLTPNNEKAKKQNPGPWSHHGSAFGIRFRFLKKMGRGYVHNSFLNPPASNPKAKLSKTLNVTCCYFFNTRLDTVSGCSLLWVQHLTLPTEAARGRLTDELAQGDISASALSGPQHDSYGIQIHLYPPLDPT